MSVLTERDDDWFPWREDDAAENDRWEQKEDDEAREQDERDRKQEHGE